MGRDSESKKVTFANQLRGLAVLSVMLGHYVWVYWLGRDTVAQYIHAPVVAGPPSRLTSLITVPTLNYGPLGVAVFFLISGFVIPFSLEKLGVIRFAIARALRIFPTFWIASLVTLSVSYLSAKYWGNPITFDGALKHQVVSNLFLYNPQLKIPSIDLVNWTLSIEVLFYICCLFLWPFIMRGSCVAMINFSALVLTYLTWAPASWDTVSAAGAEVFLGAFKYEAMMVCFITVGTLFNFHMTQKISLAALVGSAFTIFLLFLMMWEKTAFAPNFPADPINYGYGLIVFSSAYAFRSKFRAVRFLDFIADISYPLYLVHSVAGYAVIRILMDHGFRYFAAIPIAFGCVVSIAYALHVSVEMPTASLGKRAPRKTSDVARTA